MRAEGVTLYRCLPDPPPKWHFCAQSGFSADEDFLQEASRVMASMVGSDGHLHWCARRDGRPADVFCQLPASLAVECNDPKACEAARRAKAAVEAFDREVARRAGEGAAGA